MSSKSDFLPKISKTNDIFLVDDNAAGVQSSTKYITASDIASYIQVGAPLDKGDIIVGNASNISSILDAGDPGQVLKIDIEKCFVIMKIISKKIL